MNVGEEVGVLVNKNDSRLVREQALAYIASHHVVTLATNGSEGLWAAAVFYAHHDFDLVFLSSAASRHALNIASSSMVAATIQADYDNWPAIKGIQMEGTVKKLDGDESGQARIFFIERYSFLLTAPDPILDALAKVAWYRLAPKKLYFVDNSQGFGHRDEIYL